MSPFASWSPLDIPVTVSPHKILNNTKGVLRRRDLRCCSEEEMVEELSGVTHARRIKVRRGEDKIQIDIVVLTFDNPKPSSRVRAGYLTLDVCAYVPLPMRCYKCQRYGHNLIRKRPPHIHISFFWIPAHVGIQRNDNVDKLGKAALNRASSSG
ncbi:RNA-directed DNA polymerase from mobile element jockey [Plakobranchus ocellatus]|uniref:RNA-directed DNA polymerase from mobile element jockey n=1 Tax=Plakobranchus ocellatus TaxID=259542 RepID=A0AAV4A396_9GAST|nr:RNA-directed DNA polymerase from mobile element jockey [Plakobranchus ocellatus]